MFDIGFWEIVLISVIGLVVLGPQRLPIAIRSVVKWINSAKKMANSVKNEISRELELDEMNKNMKELNKKGLSNLDPNLKASIDEVKSSMESLTRPYQDDIETLNQSIKATVTEIEDTKPLQSQQPSLIETPQQPPSIEASQQEK